MANTIKYYPNVSAVVDADREQLGWWVRFLRSPETDDEHKILDQILTRFKDKGGMTPEISKRIGWEI